jgi:hypothetical protein
MRLLALTRMLSRLLKSARSERLSPFEQSRLSSALFHLERDVHEARVWLEG